MASGFESRPRNCAKKKLRKILKARSAAKEARILAKAVAKVTREKAKADAQEARAKGKGKGGKVAGGKGKGGKEVAKVAKVAGGKGGTGGKGGGAGGGGGKGGGKGGGAGGALLMTAKNVHSRAYHKCLKGMRDAGYDDDSAKDQARLEGRNAAKEWNQAQMIPLAGA